MAKDPLYEKKIRLDKFLSSVGILTRSEARRVITYGLVKVNDLVIKDMAHKIEPSKDEVKFKERVLTYKLNTYLMFNKPDDCITATEDSREKTVMDYIAHPLAKKMFPVGRLDKDTTGLLLITDDGKLAHSLLSPKKHVDKTYEASVKGRVNEETVAAFEMGITLDDGYQTLPAKLEVVESKEELSEVLVTIQEGKFHQIKRMFEAVDMSVVRLNRIRMGSLILDPDLALGEFRELSDEEVEALQGKHGRKDEE